MKENEIELGASVIHREWGVGMISDISEKGTSLTIEFSNRPGHKMSREMALHSLERLPDEGLEVTWAKDPQVVDQWYREAPLKLISGALMDIGGNGKLQSFKPALLRHIPSNIKWETWWNKYQPYIKLSPFFLVSNGLYSLKGTTSQVPFELPKLPPKPLIKTTHSNRRKQAQEVTREWIKWLFSDNDFTPPDDPPPPIIIEMLQVIPPATFARLFGRLLLGLKIVVLQNSSLTVHSQNSWKEAISICVSRWGTIPEADLVALSQKLAEDVIGITNTPKNKELANGLNSILLEVIQMNRNLGNAIAQTISNLIIKQNSNAELTFRNLVEELPEQERRLVSKIVLTEIMSSGSKQQFDSIFRVIESKDIPYLLQFFALSGSINKIDNSIMLKRITKDWALSIPSEKSEYLRAMFIAAIILGNEAEPILRIIQGEFKSYLSGQAPIEPVMSSMVTIAREEILHTYRLTEQKATVEIEHMKSHLQKTEEELAKNRSIIEGLHQQLAQKREQNLFEARRDILLVLGETLQFIYLNNRSRDELINDIDAGITLALQAGGADIIGQVGQVVTYNAKMHDIKESLTPGTEVVIKAPGLLIRNNQNEELILIRAKVVRRS